MIVSVLCYRVVLNLCIRGCAFFLFQVWVGCYLIYVYGLVGALLDNLFAIIR